MPGEQELLSAIVGLRDIVDQLNKTLKEDYPKRSEIRRARYQFALLVVIGLVVSSVVTIGTVSGCFLTPSAISGNAPGVCNLIPAYRQAQARNQGNLAKFAQLIGDIEKNKEINARQAKQIARLEREVGR